MARTNRLALEEEELELIHEAKDKMFGGGRAPNGLVVRQLCEKYLEGNL